MQDFTYGTAYRGTATGVVVVSSANARIYGVLFTGTGTGRMQLFHGVVTGNPITGEIIAYATVTGATLNSAVYYPVPAYASGGITMNIGPSADPKLTLFWSPVGGNAT